MSLVTIGSICSFFKGASIPRARMSNSGDYLYLHYGDLYKGHDTYINVNNPQSDIPYISAVEKLKEEQFVEDGDIIYILTSETIEDLGKALMVINPDKKEVVSGTETTIMKIIDKQSVEPRWLNYLLQTNYFKQLLRQYVTGMKVFRVHPRDISKIVIELPPINVQRKIVEILDSINSLIQMNLKLNDYLYACCLTKMQEVVSNASELMTVEKCCNQIYSGGTPSTKNPEYWDGNLSWLSSGETHSRFIIDTEKKITEKGVEGSSTKLAYSGDIVMASAGQGFTRGQTSMLMLNTYVNQSVVVMHPKEGYSAYLLLELADSYDKLRVWSDSTSTRGSMSGKLLKQFEIPRVDQKAAFKLERFCESLFDLIESNLRECKALYGLRDALLPKLMSGEIDISRIKLPK